MFLAVDIKTNKTFEDFLMNKKRHKVIINIQQTAILENRFLNTFCFWWLKSPQILYLVEYQLLWAFKVSLGVFMYLFMCFFFPRMVVCTTWCNHIVVILPGFFFLKKYFFSGRRKPGKIKKKIFFIFIDFMCETGIEQGNNLKGGKTSSRREII